MLDPLTKKSLAKVDQAVTFKKSVTGQLDSVEPSWGLKKGKTDLKVKGKNFGTVANDVKVFIGEVGCTVTACKDDEISCTT